VQAQFTRVLVDDDRGFSTTVLIGGPREAYCTCKDFWRGDFSEHYRTVDYYGATVPHGCIHIDVALEATGGFHDRSLDHGRPVWGEAIANVRPFQGIPQLNEPEDEAIVAAFAAGYKFGREGRRP
jgi:hypothetical protein